MFFYIIRFSYDGFLFHNQASAKNGHYSTTLAKIDEAPLAVGGESSNTNKAEILDITSNTWIEIAEYPYHAQSVFPNSLIESITLWNLKYISAFLHMQQ